MATISATEKKLNRKIHTIVNMYNEVGNYKQIIVVKINNIDASQINEIRKYMRRNKLGTIVIGKNTVIRKALQMRINGMTEADKKAFPQLKEQKLPKIAPLIDLLKDKVAFIFTESNVSEFKKAISRTPIAREAKVGSTAPCDVQILEGPTGLPPAEVNFFHALNIQVRINKGILDLQKTVSLIKKGEKVGNSEASLLKKLSLKPFTFPLIFHKIYDDGDVFEASVFEIPSEEIIARIQTHVKSMAALSMEVNHVNSLSAPLLIMNSFKQMLAIGMETKYEMEALKAASSAKAAPSSGPAKKDAPAKVEKVEEKPVEEEDVGMGGLFDF